MTDDRMDPEGLAAELALGLLSGEDYRAAKAREASDAPFAREVARWRGRFAPLVDEVEPVVPPNALWQRLERSLPPLGEGGALNSNVIALRRKVNVWRGLTGAMGAIAASLALLLLSGQLGRNVATPTVPIAQVTPAKPPMVALIKAGPVVAAVANWDSSSRRLLVSEVKMPVVPRHDYQLWVIPADGKPRSVGVMPNSPLMHVELAQSISTMVTQGATLAVSLEPPGGSRSDGPSGPVIASGLLASA